MLKLFIGAVCIGFAPIFVRLLSLGPTPIGMYRCGLASFCLIFFLILNPSKKPFRPFTWRMEIWKAVLLAGALFALDLFIWHRSVIYTGAGLSTILGNTQVFYVAGIGAFFYKERLTPRFITAVALALLGIYLLVSYNLSTIKHESYSLGITFGLATGLVYACYIVTLRRMESFKDAVPTEHALAVVSAISALCLLPVSYFEKSLRLPNKEEWPLLLGLALIAQVLGWILITRNLPKTPVSKAGLILNAQPVVAVCAGTLILGEHLSSVQLLGAVLTLAAIYLGTQRRTRKIT